MFNTVKESHIAVELGLQHITSNRKQSIAPEFIDMALNLSVLKYVSLSLDPSKNTRGTGFEHNQVAYDELSPLKSDDSLAVFYNSNDDSYFSILPSNYKHHITSKTRIQFNRSLENVITEPVNKYIYTLEFQNINPVGGVYYSAFEMRIGNKYQIKPNITLYSNDAKFMLVNSVIEYFRKMNIRDTEVYWQRYGNTYIPNTFIIVSNLDLIESDVQLILNPVSIVISKKSTMSFNEVKNTHNRESENKITKSKTKNYITGNTYYNSNSHLQLNISITGNKIIIPHNNVFRPTKLFIDYVKIPSIINYRNDTLSELIINDKIIQLAVQYLKAVIKDEGYNHMLRENQTI